MRVTVIGTGYVGLVAGACLADFGNDVLCVDVDEVKVKMLRAGQITFYEPELETIVEKNVRENRLAFTTSLADGVKHGQVIFVAVGTPEGEDGAADLSHVLQVARELADAMDGFRIVVLKSTVPVGTADMVRTLIASRTSHPFDVVSNPEFLKEGAAVEDFLRPDRVVIGTDSEQAREVMADLYAPYMRTRDRLVFMDNRSAEMTKYTANALLATRISFMNEIANLCEMVGADVSMVRKAVGADTRIGPQFLFPGVGFGGSCFPKDIAALGRTARQYGAELKVLSAVEDVNRQQKKVLIKKVLNHYGSDLSGLVFGMWGLAFKPGTDDMREAPSLTIIEGLLAAGARLRVHDPEAMGNARKILGDRVEYCDDAYDACKGADGMLVVTEWPLYRNPDFDKIASLMGQKAIFDGRNLYRADRLEELGFYYEGIGRGSRKTMAVGQAVHKVAVGASVGAGLAGMTGLAGAGAGAGAIVDGSSQMTSAGAVGTAGVAAAGVAGAAGEVGSNTGAEADDEGSCVMPRAPGIKVPCPRLSK